MVKNLPANEGDTGDMGSSLGHDNPLEKEMATHSSILAGDSQEQRSLVGYSPWGRRESDMTKPTSHTHTECPVPCYSGCT